MIERSVHTDTSFLTMFVVSYALPSPFPCCVHTLPPYTCSCIFLMLVSPGYPSRPTSESLSQCPVYADSKRRPGVAGGVPPDCRSTNSVGLSPSMAVPMTPLFRVLMPPPFDNGVGLGWGLLSTQKGQNLCGTDLANLANCGRPTSGILKQRRLYVRCQCSILMRLFLAIAQEYIFQ